MRSRCSRMHPVLHLVLNTTRDAAGQQYLIDSIGRIQIRSRSHRTVTAELNPLSVCACECVCTCMVLTLSACTRALACCRGGLCCFPRCGKLPGTDMCVWCMGAVVTLLLLRSSRMAIKTEAIEEDDQDQVTLFAAKAGSGNGSGSGSGSDSENAFDGGGGGSDAGAENSGTAERRSSRSSRSERDGSVTDTERSAKPSGGKRKRYDSSPRGERRDRSRSRSRSRSRDSNEGEEEKDDGTKSTGTTAEPSHKFQVNALAANRASRFMLYVFKCNAPPCA